MEAFNAACNFRFNSTLVRLEEAEGGSEQTRVATFQFHTGAIRSALGEGQPFIPFMSFNSTLVRLEGERRWLRHRNRFAFQFHTGAIRSAALFRSKAR